nr:histone-lysine N-methyltransferase, H3 lysine-36 and H4 lysine-20 specific-like isoform X1 [Meriones unguiculatus]XP_021520282.1 histone-lysine N-methyltransferase, H3 lysine-36 and H4 lysine-20 specific-like isoform X1 [Meriones unguiculatus]XP_021520283.1 histone-lysine N-methyltransferase, H3 lysine-36 and H4 lysine-20 specific-like isoform X1 [Meriones unguiculatus]
MPPKTRTAHSDDPDSSTSTLGNMLELPGASSSSASQELPFCQRKKTSTPLKYEVGDLIWAKFKRRPWWPCRICSDPLMNSHSKMKGKEKYASSARDGEILKFDGAGMIKIWWNPWRGSFCPEPQHSLHWADTIPALDCTRD